MFIGYGVYGIPFLCLVRKTSILSILIKKIFQREFLTEHSPSSKKPFTFINVK